MVKMNEVLARANAAGCTVNEILGIPGPADRAQFAVCPTDGADREAMRRKLLSYLELDAHLEDQAIR